MGIKEIVTYTIIILVVVIIIYLPKRSQDKMLKKMQNELKTGDKIITYSGFCGKIVEIQEDKVIVELAPDNITVTIEKWAVAGIDDRS